MQVFDGYMVDDALMSFADPDAIFLHCLPAHRGEEVSESVLEGPQSRAWAQAENRLHIQKAIMAVLMGGEVLLPARKKAAGKSAKSAHISAADCTWRSELTSSRRPAASSVVWRRRQVNTSATMR